MGKKQKMKKAAQMAANGQVPAELQKQIDEKERATAAAACALACASKEKMDGIPLDPAYRNNLKKLMNLAQKLPSNLLSAKKMVRKKRGNLELMNMVWPSPWIAGETTEFGFGYWRFRWGRWPFRQRWRNTRSGGCGDEAPAGPGPEHAGRSSQAVARREEGPPPAHEVGPEADGKRGPCHHAQEQEHSVVHRPSGRV